MSTRSTFLSLGQGLFPIFNFGAHCSPLHPSILILVPGALPMGGPKDTYYYLGYCSTYLVSAVFSCHDILYEQWLTCCIGIHADDPQ